MRARTCLLGIDVGASGTKAVLFDAQGEQLGSAYESYDVAHGVSGIVEQDPEAWWRAAHAAVKRVVGGAGSDVEIVAAGVSSTNALIAVGADGIALRPAIMQLDRRARPEALSLAAELGADRVLLRTGSPLAAGASWLPTLRWLWLNEPSTVRDAACFVFPGGLVALRLTGVAAVDDSRACTTQLFDPVNRTWCPDLAGAVGVRVDQLPKLVGATEPAGRLAPDVATELGLLAGIPVLAGPMDSVAAALGSGAIEPGSGLAVLGTIARAAFVDDRFSPDARHITATYAYPSTWLRIGAVWGAGSAIGWAASLWTGTEDYDRLDREVASVPAASTDLVFLTGGDRPPAGCVAIPGGCLVGDVDGPPAVIARAVLDGVAMATAEQVRALEDGRGLVSTPLNVSGGGARSPALRQALADCLGRDLRVTQSSATEPLGAAMLAGVAAGIFPTIEAAVHSMASGADTAAVVCANDALRPRYAALREWRSGLLNRA
jgi:xylulokinase